MFKEDKNVRGNYFSILKSKKVWITSAVLLVVIAAGVFTWFVFFGKSPLQAYMEAEGKNFKKYSKQFKQVYDNFAESQKPYMEGSYKKRMEFSLDITSDSKTPFGIQNAENILDVLRRCKFILDLNNNPITNQSRTKLSLLVEKAPFLDVQAYTKERQLGFNVPVLLPEKYFTADLDKLDQVYDRFDIPFRPKRIAKAVDVAKSVVYSDEKLEAIAKEYGKVLSGVLTNSNVKYGDKVSLKINGKDIKGQQIVVELTGSETKKLVEELAKKISADENLLRLTYENYADTAKIFDEAGYFHIHKVLDDLGYLKLNDILKEYIASLNVKKDTAALSRQINDFSRGSDFPEGLRMTLVLDADGNIVDRKLTTTVVEKNNKMTLVDIHTGTNDAEADGFAKGFADVNITFDRDDKSKQQIGWAVSSNIDISSKNGDKKGKIDFKHIRKLNNTEEFAIDAKLDLDSRIDETTFKKNTKATYDISFSGVDPKLVDRFFGEFKNEGWKNNKQKTRNSNSTLTMSFDLPTLDLKNTVVKFDFKKEDRFAVDFQLPEVQGQDTIDLNSASDNALNKVGEDIMKSFGSFYLQNKPIFDALMGQN